MNWNQFGTRTVGTGTDGIKPKTGTGSVRFEVIGTVVNLTEPAAYWCMRVHMHKHMYV